MRSRTTTLGFLILLAAGTMALVSCSGRTAAPDLSENNELVQPGSPPSEDALPTFTERPISPDPDPEDNAATKDEVSSDADINLSDLPAAETDEPATEPKVATKKAPKIRKAAPAATPQSSREPYNPWKKIKKPSQPGKGKIPQAIGTTSAGCVDGAAKLAPDGKGYHVMRLSRARYFGHPVLIKFLKKLANKTASNGVGTILIGDLGQPRGGPTFSGHASHQNGLDADIWFIPKRGAFNRKYSRSEREAVSAKSLVNSDGSVTKALWAAGNDKLLEYAASSDEVERIFVDPSIKRSLCEKEKDKAWLRKLRPWWWHSDHMHIRLKCPRGSKLCQDGPEIPAGPGCDSTLDWWFTAEAAEKKRELESQKAAPTMPVLPAACANVLEK